MNRRTFIAGAIAAVAGGLGVLVRRREDAPHLPRCITDDPKWQQEYMAVRRCKRCGGEMIASGVYSWGLCQPCFARVRDAMQRGFERFKATAPVYGIKADARGQHEVGEIGA